MHIHIYIYYVHFNQEKRSSHFGVSDKKLQYQNQGENMAQAQHAPAHLGHCKHTAALLFLVPEFRLGTKNEDLCVAVGFGVRCNRV